MRLASRPAIMMMVAMEAAVAVDAVVVAIAATKSEVAIIDAMTDAMARRST